MFHNAIDRAEPADDVKARVNNLIESITYMVFMYTTRGLFEKDKLIFTSQVTFQVSNSNSFLVSMNSFKVLLMDKQIDPVELDVLLRFPCVPNVTSPVDFLSHASWGNIKSLSLMEQFKNLDRDIEGTLNMLNLYNYCINC